MATKPFHRFEISRYADCARVEIWHVTDDGEQFRQSLVADYETLSRGAAASARREIRRIERAA